MGEFKGNDIIVRYDEHTCTHSANCVNSLPAVFNINAKPWVNANCAAVEAIKKTVSACPSGALSYEEIRKK